MFLYFVVLLFVKIKLNAFHDVFDTNFTENQCFIVFRKHSSISFPVINPSQTLSRLIEEVFIEITSATDSIANNIFGGFPTSDRLHNNFQWLRGSFRSLIYKGAPEEALEMNCRTFLEYFWSVRSPGEISDSSFLFSRQCLPVPPKYCRIATRCSFAPSMSDQSLIYWLENTSFSFTQPYCKQFSSVSPATNVQCFLVAFLQLPTKMYLHIDCQQTQQDGLTGW